MVSHGSLSDSKSPQVLMTQLSILIDFNNVGWYPWIIIIIIIIIKSEKLVWFG